jgi:hypothetical protein
MTNDANDRGLPRTPRLPPYIADHRSGLADAGPADPDVSPLRPFVQTSGCMEPAEDTLELEAQVDTTEAGMRAYPRHTFERHDIVALCVATMSIAEIGAKLGLQVGVVRVLVSDLAACGHLVVSRPNAHLSQDVDLIERLICGFEAIH